MQFYSVRDLRTSPKSVWESLRAGEVVITNNGKPAALMLDLSERDFEETLQAVRQARAMMAVKRMQERAAAAGYMTDEEINAEIAAARKEMRDAGRA
jgi:antitoxin (DNA-binding transcriptional repressor) of toxin-antitoxin stability system